MNIDDIMLEQIVTFAILMESNGGIINKAPSYIREKFSACMAIKDPTFLHGLLDSSNKAKAYAWRQRWTSQK